MTIDTDNAVTETNDPIVSLRGHVQAMAFGRKGGETLSNVLTSIADAKAAERTGPLAVFLFFDTSLTEDEQDSIPVPGSKKGETGNRPYDKYSVEVEVEGGKRMVPGSWFTDVNKSTHEWERNDKRIRWCNKTDWVSDDGEKCPKDIMEMGDGQRRVEVKRLRQRITDARSALVRGAMLWHHVNDIANLNPARIEVRMPFFTYKKEDGSAEKRTVGSSIRLIDPARVLEDKVFSVSEFLALKPNKIPTGTEATLVSLEETKARAARTGGTGAAGKGKQQVVVPTTVEGLLNLYNVANTALDAESEAGQMLLTKLLASVSGTGADVDDKIETIGDFICALDETVWVVINARYNLIKKRKSEAANQAAAMEAKSAKK